MSDNDYDVCPACDEAINRWNCRLTCYECGRPGCDGCINFGECFTCSLADQTGTDAQNDQDQNPA